MPINTKKKLAGLLLPVFALRHKNDLGIGDTAAIKEAIEFCARHGIGCVQVLPINETGGDNSPYNAISSVALEPVLLSFSPTSVPGFSESDLSDLADRETIAELRSGPVKYPAVKRLKESLLAASYDRFRHEPSPELASEFDSFKRRHASWLPEYTLFRTLMVEHGGNAAWPTWEPEVRKLEAAESWLSSAPDRERLTRYRDFCAYVQWVAFSQWAEVRSLADSRGVRLMGDIPFGISRYSADVWAEPHLFELEWSGGAPPEPLFTGDLFVQKWGQNWGIPLYNWTAHADQEFAWWRQRVERVGDFFHYFRIDHVLGFFRVYAFPWIPERNDEFLNLSHEEAAKLTGGHLPMFLPYDDGQPELAEVNASQGVALLKVIREAAADVGIVAEDLGMVPPYVRPILQALDIPGFYVPAFERHKKDHSYKAKSRIPELCLTTYATHDHMTLAAFYEGLVEQWHGPDGHHGWLEVQRLMHFLGRDDQSPPNTVTAELHRSLLEALLKSRAWMAVFMITDILLTKQRFNQPGSSGESNWSERLDLTLDAYEASPEFGPRIKMLSELIGRSGRVPVMRGQAVAI
jgi:4-alpha-glucanotransferase